MLCIFLISTIDVSILREEETAVDPMKAVKCTLQNNKDDEASVGCEPVTGGLSMAVATRSPALSATFTSPHLGGMIRRCS